MPARSPRVERGPLRAGGVLRPPGPRHPRGGRPAPVSGRGRVASHRSIRAGSRGHRVRSVEVAGEAGDESVKRGATLAREGPEAPLVVGRHHRAAHRDPGPRRLLRRTKERLEEDGAVFPAAGRREDDGTVVGSRRDRCRIGLRIGRLLGWRHDVARERRPSGDGLGEEVRADWVEDDRIPVHEDAVVPFRDPRRDVVRLPLLEHGRGIVQDVPQAEHGAPAPGAQGVEGAAELPSRAEGMLIDEHHVRLERLHGGDQEIRSERVDVRGGDPKAAGLVMAVRDLPQAREFEDVDAARQAESMRVVRARREEDRRVGRLVSQRPGDREVPTRVTQAKAVMRIQEEAGPSVGHGDSHGRGPYAGRDALGCGSTRSLQWNLSPSSRSLADGAGRPRTHPA